MGLFSILLANKINIMGEEKRLSSLPGPLQAKPGAFSRHAGSTQ